MLLISICGGLIVAPREDGSIVAPREDGSIVAPRELV